MVSDTVKEIKQSLRTIMNGVTAQSLRDKGMKYHLNWGASLGHLQEMAADYTPSRELALALWQNDIRECKILALLLMPVEECSEDIATKWITETPTQEIAELAVFYLLHKVAYAKELALRLISLPVTEDNKISLLYGYNILSRLFSKRIAFTDKELEEFDKLSKKALTTEDISLTHTVANCITKLQH